MTQFQQPSPQPPREPPGAAIRRKERRQHAILAAIACALCLVLGFFLGSAAGEPAPTEPAASQEQQTPPETTVPPPQATVPPAPWEANVLRSDEAPPNEDGKYYKDTAQTSSVFGSRYLREDICSVTFLDTLENAAIDAWDVSEAGNRSVLAWVIPNGDLYDLYIGAEGGIRVGESCRAMFMGYVNTKRITFGDVLHTEQVVDMCGMFAWCEMLDVLNLSYFKTPALENMSIMFFNCGSLDVLLMPRFDTSNVHNMYRLFYWCSSLTELELGSGFDTGNVQSSDDMFYLCPAEDKWGHLVP